MSLCHTNRVHAVHTADVDALLFGALTVYRQVELQVSRMGWKSSSLTPRI